MPDEPLTDEELAKMEETLRMCGRLSVGSPERLLAEVRRLHRDKGLLCDSSEGHMTETAENCPVCHEPYSARCRCPLSDMACKNGHHWHRCLVHDKVVLGEADHSKGTYTCRCEQRSPRNASE